MRTRTFVILILAGAAFYGCATQRKLSYIREEAMSATLSLPHESRIPQMDSVISSLRKDTLKFTDFEGREVIIMNAIKDENGDMVAHDVIDAAVP